MHVGQLEDFALPRRELHRDEVHQIGQPGRGVVFNGVGCRRRRRHRIVELLGQQRPPSRVGARRARATLRVTVYSQVVNRLRAPNSPVRACSVSSTCWATSSASSSSSVTDDAHRRTRSRTRRASSSNAPAWPACALWASVASGRRRAGWEPSAPGGSHSLDVTTWAGVCTGQKRDLAITAPNARRFSRRAFSFPSSLLPAPPYLPSRFIAVG